jgi:hypothetical protein
MLGQNETILIDTPDYSKTDRRLMAKDLDGIYWLWNTLASSATSAITPNIVLAIQKEMFRDHFLEEATFANSDAAEHSFRRANQPSDCLCNCPDIDYAFLLYSSEVAVIRY